MKEQSRTKLSEFFVDLVSVLTKIDDDGSMQVLSAAIPSHEQFFESDPKKLTESFLSFKDTQQSELKSTVLMNFDSNNYESVYQIFHDLKIAAITRFSQHEDELEVCQKIDTFYKVSVELLLRESYRLGLEISQKKTTEKEATSETTNGQNHHHSQSEQEDAESDENEEDDDFRTSLEKTLAREFELVSDSYINRTGETLSLQAPNGLPLFSSLNSFKSELDDRVPIIGDSLPVEIVKVVPNLNSQKAESFSALSPPLHRNPQQPPAQNEIMSQYFHPNWYNIPVSQWLRHGENENEFTFAPSHDESHAILSSEWKGLTWLEQYGFARVLAIRKEFAEAEQDNKQEEEEKIKPEETGADEKVEKVDEAEADTVENNNGDVQDPIDPIDPIEDPEMVDEIEPEEDLIDLENLFKWNVDNKIDEDEKELIKENKAQQSISELLLELNQLRRSRILLQTAPKPLHLLQQQHPEMRYQPPKVSKPSQQEVEKFHQLKRMIAGLIKNKDIKPADLSLGTSSELTILQHNYNGTLPSSIVGNTHAVHSMRLAGLNSRPSRRRR